MKESISATREVETSVVSLIIKNEEKEFYKIQGNIAELAFLKPADYKNLDKYKKMKAEIRKILRKNLRELKYMENISVNFIDDKMEADDIKKFLFELKDMLNEKGFNNFYLEFHRGKKGEDHVQVLADKKEKEKEIKKELSKIFKQVSSGKLEMLSLGIIEEQPKKVEIKDEKLNKFLSKLDKKLNEVFSKIDKKLENIDKKILKINNKFDKFMNKYKKTTTTSTSKKEDIDKRISKILKLKK